MAVDIVAYFAWGYLVDTLPKEKVIEVLQLEDETAKDFLTFGSDYIFHDIQDAVYSHFPGLTAISPQTPRNTRTPGVIIGKIVESNLYDNFELDFTELKALVYKIGVEPTAFLGLDIT